MVQTLSNPGLDNRAMDKINQVSAVTQRLPKWVEHWLNIYMTGHVYLRTTKDNHAGWGMEVQSTDLSAQRRPPKDAQKQDL